MASRSHLAPKPLAEENDPFIVSLRSGAASALDITRATMHLASRRVADAATSGRLGANDLDDLKKSLQELRQAESDYIRLGEEQKRLIDRSIVMEMAGTMSGRLVQCLGVVSNSIVTEVDLWVADAKFRDLVTAERHNRIRQFIDHLCSDVRKQEHQAIEKLIDDRIEDDKLATE